LRDGRYQWNTLDGSISVGERGVSNLSLPQAKITIIGPRNSRLEALKQWWISEIRRLGLVGPLEGLDDVFEFLCAHEIIDPGEQLLSGSNVDLAAVYVPDNSITNGSSISLAVEAEGCRLLFLGDSRADDASVALAPNGPSIYDAIKMSHHGSACNTNLDLLALVDSPHFFISTNGDSHGHPDYAVLKAIVDRPAAFHRILHFNYSTPASRKLKIYKRETNANFMVDENQIDWVAINSQKTI
jgi:hypothetical protein